jgi:hypothetical protein
MEQTAQGISGFTDLTHPQELIKSSESIFGVFLVLVAIVLVVGVVLALLNLSLRRRTELNPLQQWSEQYARSLPFLWHCLLILMILIGGFLGCSTLANRYHYWEQAKVAKVVASVSGDRLEQATPQVRYTVEVPYKAYTEVDGKMIEVSKLRPEIFFMAVSGSQIQVKIEQSTDASNRRNIYRADFTAEYKIVNKLSVTQAFFFEFPAPIGYTILQNLKVEQNGNSQQKSTPGKYSFPFILAPNRETKFRVTYQAQGGSRWVYDANGQLLSNFQLTAFANFPDADFASGIIPTETKYEGLGKVFTWKFTENVSVLNPFGVFTSTTAIRNLGILPRLLLLAPGILLWWLILLYFSLPMNLKSVAIASAVFFSSLFCLTYFSRAIDMYLAWSGISIVLLALVWGMGDNRRASLAAIICAISGAILPVYGLLVPYSGITLGIAGLLSVVWLAVHNWYGFLNQPLSSDNN